MQLHNLQRNTKNKTIKRIGRGGKRGYQSGRGAKGQNQHGNSPRPEIRDMIKKIPKLRGYKHNPIGPKPATVSVATLNEVFAAGELVSPQSLFQKKIVRAHNGRTPKVKVLGNGEIEIALTYKNLIFSESAREKVTKAGGTIS